MPDANQEILDLAIARSSAAVVSMPSAGILRHCKSRFLALSDNGFWVESAPEFALLADELIGKRYPVGVSFKNGDKKISFAVPILERNKEYRLNDSMVVEALLLPMPKEIKATQRRNNYRVRVPKDGDLRIRVWRIAEKAHLSDRPMAVQELVTAVRDLSMGGMGITFTGKDGEPPRVTPEDRLRVQMTFNDTVLLLEARMRKPSGAPDRKDVIVAGLRFENLDNGIEGRRTQAELNKIVGELQRDEVRRARLGISA